jgi:hypothetical protein
MATSKALQAKAWWDTLRVSGSASKFVRPKLPGRVRHQTDLRTRQANSAQPQSGSLRLQQTLKDKIRVTGHAEYRQAQRNFSDQDIIYVLLYGQIFHKAGAVLTHLREKDLPYPDRANQRYQKLIGTTVVMTKDQSQFVLTLYRNRRDGLQHIKRKPDYGWGKRR